MEKNMDINKLNNDLKNPAIGEEERRKAAITVIDKALEQHGITRTAIELPIIPMPAEDLSLQYIVEGMKAGAKTSVENKVFESSGFNIALGAPRITPHGITIPSTADDWTSPNCTRSSERHCTRFITNKNFNDIKDNLTNLGVSYTTENGATFSLTGTPKNPTASVTFSKRF
jgi:hypothetical protein